MAKLGIVTIHGMGKFKSSYYEPLESTLKKKLEKKWADISFQPIQYGDILQGPEDDLWEKIKQNNKVDDSILREFVLFGFGDAGSLEHSASTDKIQYRAIQGRIYNTLQHILLDFNGDTTNPIIIIAQSLGCQVISNYAWDSQNNPDFFKNLNIESEHEFFALKSVANLITTGCNIPIFTGGIADRKCFSPPNINFKWDNFYDPDDVLGWPLRQLGSSYEFISDHAINAGGILSSWNPACHGKYWEDSQVINPLLDIINTHLK